MVSLPPCDQEEGNNDKDDCMFVVETIFGSLYAQISEKAMATHSSTLDWQIPWTEEHGRLQSVHGIAKSQTQFRDQTTTGEGTDMKPTD